jgi:hypothetical protein
VITLDFPEGAGAALSIARRTTMFDRGSTGVLVLAAALLTTTVGALAFDETKYPDLKGQWRRGPNAITAGVLQGRANVFDPAKAWARRSSRR